MRLAWFSPLPPSTSGIAAYSAELLPLLQAHGHDVEPFTAVNAHDFVWTARRRTLRPDVYQLGNAACHDYMWAYLFRYPGLVVLHDAQLHQARAFALTKRWLPRRDDYLAEFAPIIPTRRATSARWWRPVRPVALHAVAAHAPRDRVGAPDGRAQPRACCTISASGIRARSFDAIEMGVADPLAPPARRTAAEVRRRTGNPARCHGVRGVRRHDAGEADSRAAPRARRRRARHPHLRLMLVGGARRTTTCEPTRRVGTSAIACT